MGDQPVSAATAGAMPRLRLSAWADPVVFINKKAIQSKDRFKPGAADAGNGHLDDLSLLVTFTTNEKMTLIWDPLLLGYDPPEARADFIRSCIQDCHNNNIQCLIGFTHMRFPNMPNPKFEAFNAWLIASGKDAIEKLARELAELTLKHFPDCDGISFDIEGLQCKEADIPRVSDNLVHFYQSVARHIGVNRQCAVAGAPLIDDRHASRVTVTGPDGEPQVKRLPSMVGGVLHRYDMASADVPNLVMRPMCYDNFRGHPDETILQWHRDVLDYAIKVKKIPPRQFQLGMKTIPGKFGGEVTDHGNARKRCRLVREYLAGLALFPISTSFWEPCNKTLNPQDQVAWPPSLRQPYQVPFDADSYKRLGYYKPKEL